MFAARLVVQGLLYNADATTWLGIARLAMGYPLVWQLITSTQQFGLAQQFGQAAPFVGLQNYVTLATDPYMWAVIGRSLLHLPGGANAVGFSYPMEKLNDYV